MDFGPGYRVYFGKDGERIVILLGADVGMMQAKRRDRRGRSGVERRARMRAQVGREHGKWH